MPRFAITIFLGAFLLFQVQPLMGRYIVPWFGGGASVWAACLLFFQIGLLAGYAYAHVLTRWLRPRLQGWLHLALLAATLAVLPIGPGPEWRPASEELPTAQILFLLLVNVGAPYVVLSSTGPLMQAWFAREFPGRSPYRLYSLSNAASLLALVSYPILIEPTLPLALQATVWSWTYIAFAVAAGWGAISMMVDGSGADERAVPVALPPEPPVRVSRVALWLALAAAGSAMLLATTNQLCQEVASVPFLWVVPLAVYLLTFIICFDHERWYRRQVWGPFLAITVPLAVAVLIAGTRAPFWLQVAVYTAVLFACCMVCHGELVRARPGPRHLTLFYLMVAAGGALGGAFVALAAPLLFTGYWEFHVALTACCLLAVYAATRDDQPSPTAGALLIAYRRVGGVLGALAVFAIIGTYKPWFGIHLRSWEGIGGALEWLWGTQDKSLLVIAWCLVGVSVAALADRVRAQRGEIAIWFRPALSVTALSVGASLYFQVGAATRGADHAERNFYGVLRIIEYQDSIGAYRTLVNGRITHGRQYLDPAERLRPVTYYDAHSGVGIALMSHPKRLSPDSTKRSLRVGVIGLGAGTLAAFGRTGDHFRFYEINPAVVRLSNDYFTYIKDSHAQVEIVLGDARIRLEEELRRGENQHFDVLAVDAFTSDAIPAHLLTEECAAVYFEHLAPDGLLLLHISNRFVDLEPVARALAQRFGRRMTVIRTTGDTRTGANASSWVILATQDNPIFNNEEVADALGPEPDTWETITHASTRLNASPRRIERLVADSLIPVETRDGQRLIQLNAGPLPQLWTDDFSSLWPVLNVR